MNIKALFFALALSALAISGTASAAHFCVTSSFQLQAALNAAQSNGEANTIHVVVGTYPAPAGGFVYDAEAGGNDNDLTILGGWTEYLGHTCGLRYEIDPLKTVLDGNDATRVMWIRAGGNSNVTINALTFAGGNASGAAGDAREGAGLRIDDVEAGYAATITIKNNAFMDNAADSTGGGLLVSVGAHDNGFASLRVVNNLFSGNHAPSGIGGAASLRFRGGAGMVFANNTVIHNTGDVPAGGIFAGGIYVSSLPVGTPSRVIVNNNFWDNGGADLYVADPGPLHLLHNNISSLGGSDPTLSLGNISVEPEYEACSPCSAWIPLPYSPLVDRGLHPEPSSSWYLTDYDLTGKDRVNGGRVDIGAYESHDRIFVDRFEAK